MPRTRDTRKQRAAELLKRLEDGPACIGEPEMTAERWLERYRLWCRTWVIPEVKRLVPELKNRGE